VVRTAGGSVQRYSAGLVPDTYDAAFLRSELSRLQDALNVLADGQLDLTTVAPTKPRDGMIRYGAAGVYGAGQGFYGYYAAAWHFLG
jgi:hypothetical protein